MIDCASCVHFSICTCANDGKDECIYFEKERRGEWITTSNIWEEDDMCAWGYYKECSNCHIQVKHRTPYCPYCGADMQANCLKKEGDPE